MNKTVKKAIQIMKQYNENGKVYQIPELEINDICKMSDLWDGNGEYPEDSYSYFLTDNYRDTFVDLWINYEFKILEEKDREMDTIIKITNIELL